MREYVVMPREDWVGILDAIRQKTGRGDSLYCYEVANIILNMGSNTTPYFYDVIDNTWYNNGDNSYTIPDYYMNCPHCGGNLQTSHDVDANPCKTYCPHCAEGITLVDGYCYKEERTYILRDQIMDAFVYDPGVDIENIYGGLIPADAVGRTLHIIVDGMPYDCIDIMEDADRYTPRTTSYDGYEQPLHYGCYDIDGNNTSGWYWQGTEMPTVSIYY